MDTAELIETLEEAGLSPYQASAYVAVLELGSASATEIADAGDIPDPRVYDVLRSLSDQGYVEIDEQDTVRARAHSPAEVLSDLRSRADRFEAAATEIDDRWEQPELKRNEASVVQRFRTVLDRARLFIEDASEQVYLSVTPTDFERLRDTIAEAHDRGFPIHLLVHTDRDEKPPDRNAFEGLCKEARHQPVPAPFMTLVDRQKACFSHHPDSFDQYGVLVNDQTHAFVFHWYFLTCLWDHCDVLYSARRSEPPVEYVDLRRMVAELQPALDAGADIGVSVEGYDLETGDKREISGTVTSIECAAPAPGTSTGLDLSGRVSLVVDTGERTVSVGGWGAVLEDIEGTRMVVERVDADDPVPFPAD